ncbi:MAG: hypothetical protein M3Q45_04125, partial [Chloroflexota bacterium]|nr:hypothetical protein [Chloroflexota bacterium]
MRQAYGFSDEQQWACHYGRIERTFNKPKADDNDFGAFRGKERYITNVKEIPGISPAIFARLLKSCIFIRITDLGYGLPSYNEEINRIEMAPAQARQYDWMYNILYSKIMAGVGWNVTAVDRHEAKVMLSVWLQSCLSRPNATFRKEVVHWSPNGDGVRVPYHIDQTSYSNIEESYTDPDLLPNQDGDLPMVMYPLDGVQPKEEELIKLAKAEVAAGRKLILGVRQTGTRN